MKQKTQSTFGSMDLLSGSAAQLGTSLAKVGGLALTGLTALAGLTPVLADEFAKAKVETFKLAQVFGTELEPAIQYGLDKFTEFVSFMQSGTGFSNFIADVGILTGAGGIALIASQLLGIPKSVTVGVALIMSAKFIEDSVEDATGSEIAGDAAGGAAYATGGGLIAGGVASVFATGGQSLVIAGIAALLAGSVKAFEVGSDLADKLIPDSVLNSDNPYSEVYKPAISRIFNETRSSSFYNVDTLGD